MRGSSPCLPGLPSRGPRWCWTWGYISWSWLWEWKLLTSVVCGRTFCLVPPSLPRRWHNEGTSWAVQQGQRSFISLPGDWSLKSKTRWVDPSLQSPGRLTLWLLSFFLPVSLNLWQYDSNFSPHLRQASSCDFMAVCFPELLLYWLGSPFYSSMT